jgi:hypothetical protein
VVGNSYFIDHCCTSNPKLRSLNELLGRPISGGPPALSITSFIWDFFSRLGGVLRPGSVAIARSGASLRASDSLIRFGPTLYNYIHFSNFTGNDSVIQVLELSASQHDVYPPESPTNVIQSDSAFQFKGKPIPDLVRGIFFDLNLKSFLQIGCDVRESLS